MQSTHIRYQGHSSRSSCITYGCAYVSLTRVMFAKRFERSCAIVSRLMSVDM